MVVRVRPTPTRFPANIFKPRQTALPKSMRVLRCGCPLLEGALNAFYTYRDGYISKCLPSLPFSWLLERDYLKPHLYFLNSNHSSPSSPSHHVVLLAYLSMYKIVNLFWKFLFSAQANSQAPSFHWLCTACTWAVAYQKIPSCLLRP